MGFGDLKSPAGLQVLNDYLADKSYIEGWAHGLGPGPGPGPSPVRPRPRGKASAAAGGKEVEPQGPLGWGTVREEGS